MQPGFSFCETILKEWMKLHGFYAILTHVVARLGVLADAKVTSGNGFTVCCSSTAGRLVVSTDLFGRNSA